MHRLLLAVVVLVLASSADAATPITLRVYAHTGLRLADVVWDGRAFLYVENTTNTVWREGSPPTLFASMPRLVEETRCRMSPGAHGFPAGFLYCHAPDNAVYRIAPDGKVETFARLPSTAISDGALAFDTVGRFGYRLIAATGRSGAPKPAGGTVYAVAPDGVVSTIGGYRGPGGADELVVAPSTFGSAAGQAVLAVDAGASGGTLVAMDARGRTRRIATLPDGPNPIVVVPAHPRTGATRGLYVTDTNSTDVFYAPAGLLAPYGASIVVGSEIKALFWSVRPKGTGFALQRIPWRMPATGMKLNLEGAVYVA
jgi:hypothetical protein